MVWWYRQHDFLIVGELAHGRPLEAKFSKLWFGADPSVDSEIRAKFLPDFELAISSTSEPLFSDPQSALATTILLDQFSRNMFRDTPKMFAQDAMALKLARSAVKEGYDQKISHPLMRVFFYLVTSTW